jgi:uncharacterized protein (DUF952 family)
MGTILHITTRAEWDAACAAGSYRPASLAHDGFIHGSTRDQVVASADRWFRHRADLISFPHLQGPLAIDAVAFPCDRDGRFALPAELDR